MPEGEGGREERRGGGGGRGGEERGGERRGEERRGEERRGEERRGEERRGEERRGEERTRFQHLKGAVVVVWHQKVSNAVESLFPQLCALQRKVSEVRLPEALRKHKTKHVQRILRRDSMAR